jgi:DNA (cytosine-5)-methyltransferase 1
MKIVSLFAGCGGLDLGFTQVGFDVVWANEFDKSIWETYEFNHPATTLDKRSIKDIPSAEIPYADGIIGGPPCQSWSIAGAGRGIEDKRGQLFYDYIRVLKDKQPLFFLAENVAGIVSSTHKDTFDMILQEFEKVGYRISYKLLDAKDYGVPQDRKRVIVVGYLNRLGINFNFPDTSGQRKNLRDAIGDLGQAVPTAGNKTSGNNHEYMTGGFSTMYIARNRKRGWDEPSFTIQAGGRHAPLHPAGKKSVKKNSDLWIFEATDRRLSVRECARVQTFPDNFIFKYKSILDGYKMVGNAVPVLLAKVLAEKIKGDLECVG